MKKILKITADGSHTLYDPAIDDHYHSTYGALAEADHVFAENGFRWLVSEGVRHIRILETGFGTGLNALLSLIESQKCGIEVDYHTFELYPLEKEIYTKLNYGKKIDFQGAGLLLLKMHQAQWGKVVQISTGFRLKKIRADWRFFNMEKDFFNLVYYDAFGPDLQPAMWKKEVLISIGECVVPGGILVTYSAKGQVRRDLMEAGFGVDRLPGPKGKRHMLRAVKK